jgi:dTDP-4-amino-4,6-dideoxygalactose transaminase
MDPLLTQIKLAEVGIETRQFWNPMHRQPAFVGEKSYLNGLSDDLFKKGLCLPSSNHLDINKVIEAIQRKQ